MNIPLANIFKGQFYRIITASAESGKLPAKKL